jgi:hypothetical protein
MPPGGAVRQVIAGPPAAAGAGGLSAADSRKIREEMQKALKGRSLSDLSRRTDQGDGAGDEGGLRRERSLVRADPPEQK